MIVADAKTARAILTDPLSTRPVFLYKAMRNITGGQTLLTMNGHGWYSKRKATAPAFSSNHVKRMTRVALEKTELWIHDTLIKHSSDNSSFDITKEILAVVLSALTETAFDYKLTMQGAAIFSEELDLAIIEFLRKSPSNPHRRIFGRLITERRRAYLAVQKLQSIAQRIMDTHREKEDHLRTQGTIIQLVMESEAFPNDNERAAQLLEFLLAGHETTAHSISWTLLCLAQNPEEQKKLRESLSRLTKENLTSSEYLRWVVKEGVRKYPVARSSKCGISVKLLYMFPIYSCPVIFDITYPQLSPLQFSQFVSQEET